MTTPIPIPPSAPTRAGARPFGRSAGDLIGSAVRSLAEAALATQAADRYVAAHLAALRAGAAVLAERGRPANRRARVLSVWSLLPRIAPELGEWAEFFAATGRRRAAIEAGVAVVTPRDADDLMRDAETFVARVSELLGVSHQQGVRVAS